jgi:DNA gyrase/topoisomerase IV subunit B
MVRPSWKVSRLPRKKSCKFRELFIVEGDSAGAALLNKDVIVKFQAILPLKGKNSKR